ncbi:MAG: ATP-binding protein [Ruminococcus sp.]|nr:ATP-binding protein [Ruminococcus sp.]
MTKRIFHSTCVVAISVFIASIALFMCVIYNYFTGVQHSQLKMQTGLAVQGVSQNGMSYLDGLDIDDYRITWIDKNGNVIYDSDKNSSEMENHLEREEIKEAFESGYGESSRYSNTIMERSLYSAQLLSDGTVIRLSIAQNTVLKLLIGMAQPIIIIIIIAVILSIVLASRLSKSIVKPLNELNLDVPLSNDGYDELAPLLKRIDRQQKQIKMQNLELTKKQLEFEAVTSEMNEGIILLNKNSEIISINNAAKKLFVSDNYYSGQNFLTLNHSYSVQKLISDASEKIASELKIHFESGEYQLNATPVISNDEVAGIVLLAFDITEKEKAEQMRREFTANVSHELKTPLHTISGCAEIMKNGIVKDEDIPKFSEQIYNETQRMISLVDDIIRLSHLDEGASDMKKEVTDIFSIANDVVKSLSNTAKSADVTLDIVGESTTLFAIPQLIYGIIYNLCDNAIKYNKKGGSVTIEIINSEKTVELSVSDTGIGILPEHQDRIFERFYRVDKSHSKSVGGTGLGLSIVKHVASLHNAQLSVHSIIGSGTTIKVIFPK